jgi:hypothetical protein
MPDENPILGKRAKAAALLPRKDLATDIGRDGEARSTAPADITTGRHAGFIVRRPMTDRSTANLVVELAGFSQAKQARHSVKSNPSPPTINRVPEPDASEARELLQFDGVVGLAEARKLTLPKQGRPPAFGLWRRNQVDATA